jgi:cytochrome c biogenesis protein CcmG, thiol:disulfide interchange protein DsbE
MMFNKRKAERKIEGETGNRKVGHPPVAIWWKMIILIVLLLAVTETGIAALRIGDMLPSFTFAAIDGRSIRIPDYLQGRVIILHFWMIGCSSCREEMPAMETLYVQYRNKGLEILAVNIGQKKETVKKFGVELKVSYPILIDPDLKGSLTYNVTDVPRTYLIDRRGIIRYKIFGGAPPELLKKLALSLL